jgi:hypothetical protein
MFQILWKPVSQPQLINLWSLVQLTNIIIGQADLGSIQENLDFSESALAVCHISRIYDSLQLIIAFPWMTQVLATAKTL